MYTKVSTSGINFLFFTATFLCTEASASILTFFFKYSFTYKGSWLLDLGAYESASTTSPAAVAFYVWMCHSMKVLILTFSKKRTLRTCEGWFRNAKWLERELGEMHGFFFESKKDRRALFLVPVFFITPLKKAFPVGGFFDLILCPLTAKLTFRHISWQG